jgi:hypothetical protein
MLALLAVVYARRADTRAKNSERAEERRQLQELLRIAERVIHLATEISDNAHERQELAREARGLLAGASLNLPATEHLATQTYGDRREVWTAAATASRDELLARLRAAGFRPATSDAR